jgi:hypothetical protein
MIQHPYRINETVRDTAVRLEREQRQQDPREQAVYLDRLEAVKASVRAERLQDLERLWADNQTGLMEYWVVRWFPADPGLYTFLSAPAHAFAARVLQQQGLL